MSAEAIYCALTEAPGHEEIAALVGTRIEPNERPQDDPLPGISYELDGRGEARTTGGPDTLRQSGWSLFCWAEQYDEALALAKVVATQMHGFAGFGILEAVVTGERDEYEEETKTHARVVELAVIARGV